MTKSTTRVAADLETFTQTEITAKDVVAKAGRKNLIINGSMQVSQRGASFTADGFSLDRWYHQLSGATSTTTQETFALGSEVSGCSHYLKQATSAGNNYCGLVYKVEDVMSVHEGKATFSFYAKGANPAGGSFTVRLARLSTGVTFYDTPLDSTLTLTASWQRFIYTFDVATFSGMGAVGSDSKLYISIHQADGDVSATAWELNITGVQLELGSVATDFEHRSYGEELALCQRYYETSFAHGVTPSNGPSSTSLVSDWMTGIASNRSNASATIFFKVRKRVAPTLNDYGASNGYLGYKNMTDATDFSWNQSTIGARAPTQVGFMLSQGFSNGNSFYIQFHYTADAEL